MNTNKKLREALETIVRATCDITLRDSTVRDFVKQFAEEALALPRRNCDVGSGVELSKRFNEFCHWYAEKDGCTHCPLLKMRGQCQFNWGQLPYKKEGI